MTEQIKSIFQYKSMLYSAFISHQNQLFNPSIFQLHPSLTTSANWDGYQATYTLLEQKLVLSSLRILLLEKKNNTSQHIKGPVLRGVTPIFDKRGFFNNYYKKLNIPLDYSGKILLARKQKKVRHFSDFSFLWDYEDATELILKNGELLKEQERNGTMMLFQKAISEEKKQQNPRELFDWCELFFEYPYDMQV